MTSHEFDVAVVGGGPGGSAAAKKCAECGLKTVLLEKARLPRNKVCSGMIFGEMAQAIVTEQFGDPPREILTTPPYLLGIKFHAQNAETVAVERRTPFAWRKDFDYWLNQVSQRAGVELWDRAKITGVVEEDNRYILNLEKDDRAQLLRARFLIGADGAISIVRKALFPSIEMRYQLAVRLCYQGSLTLEHEYAHYFGFPDLMSFAVNFKGDISLLEITPLPSQKDGSEIVQRAHEWLAADYGFSPDNKLLWRDGCFSPYWSRGSFSSLFPIARNNALLVGDAAGLIKPVTGEGISTAIKSGIMAAEAIIKAQQEDKKAEEFYLSEALDTFAPLETIYPPAGIMREKARQGMDSFLKQQKEIFSLSIGIL